MAELTPVFQDHHIFERILAERNDVVKKLIEAKVFNINDPANRINLPADAALAAGLGVTSHSGGPIGAYSVGLQKALSNIADSPDFKAAVTKNDMEALGRVAQRVNDLRDTMAAD